MHPVASRAGMPTARHKAVSKRECEPHSPFLLSKVWRAEGIQICIDLIQQLQQIKGVAGVHIMAIEWEEAVKPIVEGAGLYPRPPVEDTVAA